MSRGARIFIWVGSIFTVLGVIAVIVVACMPYVLEHRVNAEIAAIKAKGEPVTMSDLTMPKIDDSKNGAVLYRQAFQPLSEDRVQKEVDEFTSLCSNPPKNEDPRWEQGKELTEKYSRTLELAEKASALPECQYHNDWSKRISKTQFSEFAGLRLLARLVTINAVVQAHYGNTDSALKSVRLGYKISDSMKDEPTLISQLVRVGLAAIASRGLTQVTQGGSITGEQAKGLFDDLGKIDLSSGWKEAMIGERASWFEGFGPIRKDGPDSLKESMDMKPVPISASSRKTAVTRAWQERCDRGELLWLQDMEKGVALCDLPYREIKAKGLDKDRPHSKDDLPELGIGFFAGSLQFRDECIAKVAGDQILLALIAFKDTCHRYPDSLDELRTKLGWKIPIDPFSGKDFVYRRKGDGFIFYSFGPNLKDDGGVEPKEYKDIYTQGDMVWKRDR
jgi:hypothetical protein